MTHSRYFHLRKFYIVFIFAIGDIKYAFKFIGVRKCSRESWRKECLVPTKLYKAVRQFPTGTRHQFITTRFIYFYMQEHNPIYSVAAKKPIERASSSTLLITMVCFSFLSESSPGCVASSGSSTWWFVHVACKLLLVNSFNTRTNTSPPDLVTAIKEAHSKNEKILNVSVANDGDWFLRTDSVNSKHVSTTARLPFLRRLHLLRKKPGNDPMTSRVLQFCHVATMKTGRETGLGNIAWITFTPDGQGFIGVVSTSQWRHALWF